MVTDQQLIKIANFRKNEVKLANQLTKIANFRKASSLTKKAGPREVGRETPVRNLVRHLGLTGKLDDAVGMTGAGLGALSGLPGGAVIGDMLGKSWGNVGNAEIGRELERSIANGNNRAGNVEARTSALTQLSNDNDSLTSRLGESEVDNKLTNMKLEDSENQTVDALAGAGIGAAGGGAIGSQIGDGWGGTGAVAGGLAGGAIGHQYGDKIRGLISSIIS